MTLVTYVLWNNKILLLSCILLVIATSHTTMHGSMNIKFIIYVDVGVQYVVN